jgi:hypothetical protein
MTRAAQKARILKGAYLDHQPQNWEPTFTLDRHIAAARKDMGEQRWQELNAEWDATPALTNAGIKL